MKLAVFFISFLLISLTSIKYAPAGSITAMAEVADPQFEIQPDVSIVYEGQVFNVSVIISNLDASKRLVAAVWCLYYQQVEYIRDSLDLLSTRIGPFLPSYAKESEVLLYWYWEYKLIDALDLYAITILPTNNSGYYLEPYPSGNGVVATMTFRLTSYAPFYQEISLPIAEWLTWWYSVDESDLQTLHEHDFTSLTSGNFTRVILGDIDASHAVDIRDVAIVDGAFGSYPGRSKWNPNADINQDHRIDIMDIAKVSANFGHHYP